MLSWGDPVWLMGRSNPQTNQPANLPQENMGSVTCLLHFKHRGKIQERFFKTRQHRRMIQGISLYSQPTMPETCTYNTWLWSLAGPWNSGTAGRPGWWWGCRRLSASRQWWREACVRRGTSGWRSSSSPPLHTCRSPSMCSPRHRVSAALQVVLEVMLSRKHKHTVVIKWKIPDQLFLFIPCEGIQVAFLGMARAAAG